jgi:hypothetical protein
MPVRLAMLALLRHPARTLLALLGIAVSAALLLDMVMLASGMRENFKGFLMLRGYQLRVAPKGTLPFDSDATIDSATALYRTEYEGRGELEVEGATRIQVRIGSRSEVVDARVVAPAEVELR